MTASTLYEAVEPHAVWRKLFAAIVVEIVDPTSKSLEGLDLALFVLKTFPTQDEEVQLIHLVIVFCGVLDVLAV